jgi:FtsP/CotA-like multicopper oxidase with cupredoxin domain
MTPLSGFSMSWSPDRPGNWLFHCHFAMHLHPDSLSAAPDDPHMHGMSGLVVGVDVAERPGVRVAGAPTARRNLSMIAVEDSAGPDMNSRMMAPSMHFVLEERGRRVDAGTDFSPELDLVRGEPVSITIVNHLHESTSVHWHGIEVEDSYVDGVPGFSGSAKRLAPAIAPGDSFEARFTPRRSGTFMYHAHVDEEREQVAGLEGALIVRDSRDISSADEHVFFIKSTRVVSEHAPLEVNGRTEPDTVVLRVGRPARLRLIQLSTHHFTANLTFRLTTVPDAVANESGRTGDPAVVQWRPVAKDGADLPEAARTPRLAEQIISMGETYDFEYTPRQRGMLRLEVMTSVIPGTPTRSRVLIAAPIRVE